MKEPLIINLARTGMIPTKTMTPHIPVTPQEIVQDVLDCAKLGVSMAHIHMRDAAAAPTHEPGIFREIVRTIRRRNPQVILTVTTSGKTYNEFEKRAAVDVEGDAKPDMASLTLSSVNSPADVRKRLCI